MLMKRDSLQLEDATATSRTDLVGQCFDDRAKVVHGASQSAGHEWRHTILLSCRLWLSIQCKTVKQKPVGSAQFDLPNEAAW